MSVWTRFCIGVAAAGMVAVWPLSAQAASVASGPKVGARAAILVDARTGQILYEKNAFLQMDPASVTKMMTALLVIQHGHLNRIVTISKRADYTPGSSLHIQEREQYTRRDLLKGLLMRSGNDASVALAESDAGSVERFVAQMNVKAQELGAFNTAFENPNGLTEPGHYSSAYDLALIARTALAQPLFQEIVRTQVDHVTELRRHRSRSIHNTNRLLYGFPGADGVKTGTTDAAGKCLVASATRSQRQLIAVVLNSPDRWQDASRLLNWGFRHWSVVQAVVPGQPMARLRVVGGTAGDVSLAPRHGISIEVPQGESFRLSLTKPDEAQAPVDPQRAEGFVTVRVGGQPPQRAGLYPERRVPAKLEPAPRRFWDWLVRRPQPR